MSLSSNEVIELFRTAVYAVENKRIEKIEPKMELGALGLSSVSTMEVIGELEEKLNVQFPDDDLASLNTVEDLVTLVQRIAA